MAAVKLLTDSEIFLAAIPTLSFDVNPLPAGSPISIATETSGKNYHIILGLPAGVKGDKGDTPNFTIGTINTVAAGSSASATIGGTTTNPVLNLSLPRGNTGLTPAFTIGNITSGAAGSAASAALRGTVDNPILDLVIPRGNTGLTPALTIGNVTTLAPGSNATATLRGTVDNPILDLALPRGAAGAGTGDVVAANYGTEYVDNKDLFLSNVGAGTGTGGGRAVFKAADAAAVRLAIGAVAASAIGTAATFNTGIVNGTIPVIGPGDTLSGALIPVTLGHALDVLSPDNSGTTGGLRVRATSNSSAIANQANIQFLSNDGSAQYGVLYAQNGTLAFDGQFLLPSVTSALTTAFRVGTSTAAMSIVGYWNAQAAVALTDAASVVIDMSTGVNFTLVLTSGIGATRALANPTLPKVGQFGWIRVVQDATGGRLLTFGANFRAEDNTNFPLLNLAANAVTVLRYQVTAANEITIFGGKPNTPPKGFNFHATGVPAADEVLGSVIAPYAVTLVAANCRAQASVAATGSTTLILKNNNTQIGTVVFAASATLGTVNLTAPAIALNDRITFHNASTADGTLTTITVMLKD